MDAELPLAPVLGLAMVVPAVLLLGSLGIGLLYDDARMIALSVGSPLHLLRSFVETREEFYRPLYEILLGVEGAAFGGAPAPYHLTSLAIHFACSWLAYRIARPALGFAPALLGALLFLGGSTHVEAVVWISALSTALSALGCLLAMLALELAEWAPDPRSAARWRFAAVGGWLFGLGGKENAYTFPLAVAVLWWIRDPSLVRHFPRSRMTFLAPALAIMAIYAPLRVAAGTAYHFSITPVDLIKNAAYYAVTGLLPLPDDYRYASDLSAWRSAPWIGLICLLGVVPAAIWIWRNRAGLAWRPALAWLGWSAVLILPGLPILAEREAYLPTAGVCLAMASLVAPKLPTCVGRRVRLGAAALACFVLVQWLGLGERLVWWNVASARSGRIVAEVLAATTTDPAGTFLAIYNVPDRVHVAHVQGIHVCWTLQVASNGRLPAPRCLVSVTPDDGTYSAPAALDDLRSRLQQHPVADPMRLLVLADDRLAYSERSIGGAP